MYSKSILWKIAAAVLLIAILTGCGGAQPSLEPTVNTQPTVNAIQTQAVATAVMDMTLKAPTAAPVLPTATALPPTEAPTLAPTNTPEPVVVLPTAVPTATRIPPTQAPVYTATSTAYNCTVTEASPAFGADIRFGGDFDGKWVVKNTGTETWSSGDVDIKYVSGTKFQVSVDALDLGKDVAKGESYTIIVDMLAPADAGRYSASWAVTRGSQTICWLPLTIDVVK